MQSQKDNQNNSIKVFFLDIFQAARLRPIMFVVVIFAIVYGASNCIVSTVETSLYIGFVGIYSLILGISKLFALIKYKQVQQIIGQNQSIQDAIIIQNKAAKNIAISLFVVSFFQLSFAIVSTFFDSNQDTHSTRFSMLFVFVTTVVKVLLNIIQLIRTYKEHNKIIYYIKLADIAAVIISIALLQRTILLFVSSTYLLASGIIGIALSLVAMLIATSLLIIRQKPITDI